MMSAVALVLMLLTQATLARVEAEPADADALSITIPLIRESPWPNGITATDQVTTLISIEAPIQHSRAAGLSLRASYAGSARLISLHERI